jgi:ABC-2 type transport system ATP-binding protein
VRQLSTLGIRTLTSTPPTLEELFLRHYGDEIARLGIDEHEEETRRLRHRTAQ